MRQKPDSDPLPWKICDTMGLEKDDGLNETELEYLVDGNIPDRFQVKLGNWEGGKGEGGGS